MAKTHPTFRCTTCGATAPRWVGRCPSCGEWSSLVSEVTRLLPAPVAFGAESTEPADGVGEPVPIGQVGGPAWQPVPTGLAELDRVLGGGLVPGSVTLLGGEPGVGKSTLLLQALARLARAGQRCLLVAAEESPQQVRLRAERLETVAPELWLVAETDLDAIEGHVARLEPRYLVVDSIQAVSMPGVTAAPGSVAQVRACAAALVRLAKDTNVTTILVGHVTKDGSLAGPRVLEHAVDTVLSFGGDRHHALRLLRAAKHRFGPTTELGLFEMGEGGLETVADAGRLFLSDRRAGASGSVVAPALDGRRPLVVELQALVAPAPPGAPVRRSAQGVDGGRLSLLLAVLERRAGLKLATSDVYALAVGGAKVVDPGTDLPLALAVASSYCNAPVAADVVACGEVGLGGELHQVPQLARRLAEAARLGFAAAVVPMSAPEVPAGMVALRAETLPHALDLLGIERANRSAPPRPPSIPAGNR